MTATFGEIRTKKEKRHDAELMERVKRGIALLEREYGPSWVDHIDLDRLDLRSGGSCVLGQLYGCYTDGLQVLWPELSAEADTDVDGWEKISAGVGHQHGFFAASDRRDGCYGPSQDWIALNEAWKDALTPLVTKYRPQDHAG